MSISRYSIVLLALTFSKLKVKLYKVFYLFSDVVFFRLVVSTDGVLWMGLTDDKLLYISTCRNITLWHLNNFYSLWGLARNPVSQLSLAAFEGKTTRLVATGEDSRLLF